MLLKRIADENVRLFKKGRRRTSEQAPSVEEAPFVVPDQWEWVRLGDIAYSRLGKMLDKSKNKGPYRPYLRNANVQWFRFDLSDVLELRLEEAELEECSVKAGDLVVCEGGEPGRAAVCDSVVDGMVFQKALHRVRPLGGISTWYLAYLLRWDIWSQRINPLFTGATIKHLTGKALATHMVPLPPVSEQYRIVTKINELMGLIDRLETARRNREAVRTAGRDSALTALRNASTLQEAGTAWTRIAERMEDLFTAPADLAHLREAVLHLAVHGRLVPQITDDEPSSGLLKRIALEKARLIKEGTIKKQRLESSIERSNHPFDLPRGWSSTRLSFITVCLDYMRKPVSETERAQRIADKSQTELFPYFGATRQQGWIDDYLFDEDLVLLGEDGVPFLDPLRPKAYLVTGKSWVNNHAHVFRSILVSNAYLIYWLNTFDYSGRVAGTTRSKLNQAKALDIPIMLPPLAEQHRIVAKVDELMGVIDRLEEHLCAKEEIQGDFAEAVCSSFNKG